MNDSFDIGTPWLYQHEVRAGFNPARIIIRRDDLEQIQKRHDNKLLVHAMSAEEQTVEATRAERQWQLEAEPLCRDADGMDLPPFRDINYRILADESKIYPREPSKHPEIFRSQWAEKRDTYLKSGRRKNTSSGNTVPIMMLLIPESKTSSPQLRTVIDLRKRDQNTHRLMSPLPDMNGIIDMLSRAASKPFHSASDPKNAYGQIRIMPGHDERSTVTAPGAYEPLILVIRQPFHGPVSR